MLLALAACDPCTGVGTCGEPQVRYEGVLTRQFGFPRGPAEKVTVKFVRTGGVSLESDTLVARSDEEGKYRFESRAGSEGQVTGDLWIYPPGPIAPLVEPGIRLATSRAPGEVLQLGEREIPFPHLGYQIHLRYLANDQPAQGIEATFRRTGGIQVDPDTFTVTSDSRGVLLLRPRTREYGEVTGELTINPPPPFKPIVFPGYTMRTFVTDRPDSAVRVGIGSRLPYAYRFYWSHTGEWAADVEVEFVRTGGIFISPARYLTRTDRFGSAFIVPTPLGTGEVVGDVVVRPPAPGRGFTLRDVRLRTVEDERTLELLGIHAIPVQAP